MFPDESACAEYLYKLRWPDGFVCPDCRKAGEPYRIRTRPTVFQCRPCGQQTSLTAGTVMHATRTPLQVWFWAAYLVTAQTPGMSALQFQRRGSSTWSTVRQVQTANREGFLLAHQSLPSAGNVRLAWTNPANGAVYYSRTVAVS